jgi:uncharacterized protein
MITRSMKKSILLLAGCALIASCAIQKKGPTDKLSATTRQLLQQARAQTGDAAVQSNFLAAARMIQNENINAAQQQINKLKQQPFNAAQRAQLHLLRGELLLQKGKPYEALRQFNHVKHIALLSLPLQQRYYSSTSQAYLRNNQTAQSLIMRLLNPSQHRTKNQLQSLWFQLQALPIKTLNRLQKKYRRNQDLQGWLRLALIAKQSTNAITLANALQLWQSLFPAHPGNALIPNAKQLQQAQQTQPIKNIALLLPLTGKFGTMGKVVRDGFMLAYFQLPTNKRPSLRVYDTANGDMSALYNMAVKNGAQLIVGPLTPDHVNALSEATISTPVIALNYTHAQRPAGFLAFGLSPQQATKQSALKAWDFGVNKIISITPDSSWGASVGQTFSKKWQQLGGTITQQLAFSPARIKQQIAQLLHIDQSIARKNALEKILKQSVKFTPRRRQDINGVFLAATASQARQILPLLRFYFAGNLPVFSTPQLYSAMNHAQELNGVYFCAMPLLISNQPQMILLRQKIRRLWPQNFHHFARLYGVGMDAFHLAMSYSRLFIFPSFGLQGVTGRLYLTQQGNIYRQLDWAKMTNARPKPLT